MKPETQQFVERAKSAMGPGHGAALPALKAACIELQGLRAELDAIQIDALEVAAMEDDPHARTVTPALSSMASGLSAAIERFIKQGVELQTFAHRWRDRVNAVDRAAADGAPEELRRAVTEGED